MLWQTSLEKLIGKLLIKYVLFSDIPVRVLCSERLSSDLMGVCGGAPN